MQLLTQQRYTANTENHFHSLSFFIRKIFKRKLIIEFSDLLLKYLRFLEKVDGVIYTKYYYYYWIVKIVD